MVAVPMTMPTNFYETDKAVSEYLLFHYGAPEEVLPYDFGPTAALNYPVRCVTECLNVSRLPAVPRALDLGCAVGRSSFELARHFREVIGIDFSERLIGAASQLKIAGTMDYSFAEQGDLLKQTTATVPPDIDRSRVAFEQGDAMDLRDHLGQFDALIMANLVDRLQDPAKCLERISGLLNPGGQLIITTPCTWLEEYTPKENWLGGFEKEGKPVMTIDGLRAFLDKDFELTATRDLPFLIREHARKYQWSVAQASLWRRR